MIEYSPQPTEEQAAHYPEVLSIVGPEFVPTAVEIHDWEKSPEGYLELEWQYRDTQRALALDFDHFGEDMSIDELRERAKEHIDTVNEARIAAGYTPLEITEVSAKFLHHMLRPTWHEELPKDSAPEDLQHWEEFKGQYPEHMQVNLEELRSLDGKLRVLASDELLRNAVVEMRHERIEVMRAASAFIGSEFKEKQLIRRIDGVRQAASLSNRSLSQAEQRHIERLQEQQVDVRKSMQQKIKEANIPREILKSEVARRRDIQRRKDFERGLVMTDQMVDVIDEITPVLMGGKPVLLVGETGGAKTALAEYVSKERLGTEPEIVSGSAELNVYQLMGKASLINGSSGFDPGPVVRAMESGRPLIVDEANAVPSEILKRFNKIAQLRPGDTYTVQEDSGYKVTVKPGFCIIATMNEKSKRYRGVEDLSVEFRNRFGANVINVHYPDHTVPYGGNPTENMMVARAAMTDRSGALDPTVPEDQLDSFVRAAHITQQIFSGKHGIGLDDYIPSERKVDKKPGLDEAVIAPRTMVAILEKVRDSHGSISLKDSIHRFVDGIKGDNDREVIKLVLSGQSTNLYGDIDVDNGSTG